MKTVIEMALEAEFHVQGLRVFSPMVGGSDLLWLLERFAELVRADEREKYKWDVHSCGPTCKRYACVAMREAVEAEREALYSLETDAHFIFNNPPSETSQEVRDVIEWYAAAIRARGSKT